MFIEQTAGNQLMVGLSLDDALQLQADLALAIKRAITWNDGTASMATPITFMEGKHEMRAVPGTVIFHVSKEN